MSLPIVMTDTVTVPSCPDLDTAGTALSNLSVKNLAIFVDYIAKVFQLKNIPHKMQPK